jgi:hypothetical protein
MRAAAACIGAAAFLLGCSRAEEDRNAIFLAGLDELGKAFNEARLPLCATLSERRPLARRSWAFVQAPPPAGFEEVANSAPVVGRLSLESLRPKLPRRWFIQEDSDEPCFQFTRPLMRDTRAVVTGAFGGGGEDLLGTWNFWLRKEGDRWRVVATTKGHHDI